MERFYKNLQAGRTAIEACGLGVMLYSYLNCSGAWKMPQGWRSIFFCCIGVEQELCGEMNEVRREIVGESAKENCKGKL